jgi:hypothetical protein
MALATNTHAYYRILHDSGKGVWMFGVPALLFAGTGFGLSRSSLRWKSPLLALAVVAVGGYWLVYVEARYIAPFLTISVVLVLSSVRFRRLSARRCALVLAPLVMVWVASLGFTLSSAVWRSVRWHDATDWNRDGARGLTELGVQPGSRLAVVGNGFTTYWARLAEVQVVAEVPLDQVGAFWSASGEVRSEVFRLLRERGVVAVVSERPPSSDDEDSWQRIEDTPFYLLSLAAPAQAEHSRDQATGPSAVHGAARQRQFRATAR